MPLNEDRLKADSEVEPIENFSTNLAWTCTYDEMIIQDPASNTVKSCKAFSKGQEDQVTMANRAKKGYITHLMLEVV